MIRLDSAAAARLAKVIGFIVVFLRLGEMLIDAGEVFAMAFLRMVPDQNGLTERDHFKSFSGGEMSPGCNVCVLFGELSKPGSAHETDNRVR